MKSTKKRLKCKINTLTCSDRSPIPEKDPFVKVMSAKEFFGGYQKPELTAEEEAEIAEKNSEKVEKKFARFNPNADDLKPGKSASKLQTAKAE